MSTEASKESVSELLLKEITGSKFCDQQRSGKEISVRLAFWFFTFWGGGCYDKQSFYAAYKTTTSQFKRMESQDACSHLITYLTRS